MGRKNFELEKDLVANIVDRFSIGPQATQVAVISYSGFAVVNFNLSRHTTRDEILMAVEDVRYFNIPGMETRTMLYFQHKHEFQ